MTILEAIRAGDAARVAELLDADPHLLGASEGNVSAILLAVYHGRADIARLFVDRGAVLSFGEAIALGETARVEELLAADPALLQARTDGFPAVAFAAFFGHSALARELIARGADIHLHADNPQRVTAMHAAAAVCDRETVRVLLERGADPNARQQHDYVPLHTAASRGDVEMAKLLLAHGADPAAIGSDGLSVEAVARKYGKDDFAEWFAALPA